MSPPARDTPPRAESFASSFAGSRRRSAGDRPSLVTVFLVLCGTIAVITAGTVGIGALVSHQRTQNASVSNTAAAPGAPGAPGAAGTPGARGAGGAGAGAVPGTVPDPQYIPSRAGASEGPVSSSPSPSPRPRSTVSSPSGGMSDPTAGLANPGAGLDDPIAGLGNQLPVLGDQLPAVGNQLPAVGDQLPAVGNQLPVQGDQLPLVGDPLRALGNEQGAAQDQAVGGENQNNQQPLRPTTENPEPSPDQAVLLMRLVTAMQQITTAQQQLAQQQQALVQQIRGLDTQQQDSSGAATTKRETAGRQTALRQRLQAVSQSQAQLAQQRQRVETDLQSCGAQYGTSAGAENQPQVLRSVVGQPAAPR